MTNSPVKGVGQFYEGPALKAKVPEKNSLSGSFGDVFGKTYGQTEQQKMAVQCDQKLKTTSPVKSEVKAGNANTSVDEKKTDAVQNTEDTVDEEEKVSEAGEKLVEAVAGELGISIEDVKKALEELGMVPADLLNTESMTQLFMTLTGSDMLTVLTDDSQYQSLQNLLKLSSDSMNQLLSDLGITPQELNEMLKVMKSDETLILPEEKPVEAEKTPDAETVQKAPENAEEAGAVLKDGKTEESAPVQESSLTKEDDITVEKIQPEQEHQEKPREDGAAQKDNNPQGSQGQVNVLLDQLLRGDARVSGNGFDEAMAARNVSTQDVVNQILDYMKVQMRADLTQMEIQLHPASLGTVNVNITSKDGVISAQFLAQNEAVKSVIESQIVQLKNSFEEQGLKVSAVEVAVESRSFDKGQSQYGGTQQESRDKKSGPRKINLNLNELSAEEEADLDESEQIAVDIMTANGNTVDYAV